jgi:arsenate reductase
MQAGWSREQLRGLAAVAGLSIRKLLRDKEAAAAALLADGADDDRILDAMVEHPILVNRPIVVTPLGVKLCRPSEAVFDLLDRKVESFTKEDGEVVRP